MRLIEYDIKYNLHTYIIIHEEISSGLAGTKYVVGPYVKTGG